MSYQNAAEAVRSRGRGEDTMLVHMTPGEVKGLQQLAMANGGSLTINPDTGLPEAGFLKSLLPTLIGAGLTVFSGGAINPLTAGFMVGGLEAARTGDIGRGLMAGLGAYGGAGLGSAASAAGAATAPTTAGVNAAQAANVSQVPTVGTTVTPLGEAMQAGSSQAIPAFGFSSTGPVAPTALETTLANATVPAAAPTTAMGQLAQAGQGVSNMFASGATGETARSAAMSSLGGVSGAAKTGMAALAGPLSQPAPMPEVEEYDYNYEGPYKPTKREVTYPGADRDPADSSEFLYFRDSNPYPGFESYAGGGVAKPQFTQTPAPAPAAPINTAPTGYVAGRDAEFNYGFKPMASNMPSTQGLGGLRSPIQIGAGNGFAGTNITGKQHMDLVLGQMMKHPKFGPQLRADGYAEGGPTAAAPPEGYVPGQSAEFNYGFQPMAAQVPEIQQEAATQNTLVQAPVSTGGDGGNDYMGPGTPINRVNTQLPPEVRQTLADRIAMAQQERAAAAAAIASGNTSQPYDSSSWDGNETAGSDYGTMSGAGSYSGDIDRSEAYFRRGGSFNMDNGGFVIDAHTVSEIGNGSSDAGHSMLANIGGEPIKGAGDGTSDSIRANIGGVQEARIAKDESYFSKEDVKRLGGGNYKKGEKKLYALMKKAHESRKKNGRGQASGLDKLITRMA